MEIPQLIHATTSLFDKAEPFVNVNKLFYSYFNLIPNRKTLDNVDGTKIRKWLANEWTDKILYTYVHKEWDHFGKDFLYSDLLHVLNNRMILSLERTTISIYYDPALEDESSAVLSQFFPFNKKNKITQEISMVVLTVIGFGTREVKIIKPKLNIKTHYNDDLSIVHPTVLSNLKANNKSGLHLFYGPPGTGKSTYIRYILRSINKKVIFIPPGLASNLDAPNFTAFIIKQQNTVFIVEDAEELLISRDGTRNSSLSMILNLTDGLLGSCLGIQIIATFNTDLKNIDKALLRKGRLLSMYEFNNLSQPKIKDLLNSLGHQNFAVNKSMTLADIYNIHTVSYAKQNKRTPIGFLANAD